MDKIISLNNIEDNWLDKNNGSKYMYSQFKPWSIPFINIFAFINCVNRVSHLIEFLH